MKPSCVREQLNHLRGGNTMLWLCCVETQLISFLGKEESPAEWGVQILYHDPRRFIHKYFHTFMCELIGTVLHHTLNFGGNLKFADFSWSTKLPN